jgi:DNA-binding transcriptional LysR family regulator
MNLQDIEAFVAVAETGSVNRAAVRLNLTQPATTRRIQNFEAAIGDTPLFNRAVKPAALTSLGSHVLEHCRRVLTAVAELEACTTKAADPAGDLKAGVAHGLGEIVLTTPLDALRRTFRGSNYRSVQTGAVISLRTCVAVRLIARSAS